jgi:hypothetical protein
MYNLAGAVIKSFQDLYLNRKKKINIRTSNGISAPVSMCMKLTVRYWILPKREEIRYQCLYLTKAKNGSLRVSLRASIRYITVLPL